MDKKSSYVIGISIFLGFVVFGLLLLFSLSYFANTLNKKRYEFIRVNDTNIVIFDTHTGHYLRRFIEPNEGPKEWIEEIPPIK